HDSDQDYQGLDKAVREHGEQYRHAQGQREVPEEHFDIRTLRVLDDEDQQDDAEDRRDDQRYPSVAYTGTARTLAACLIGCLPARGGGFGLTTAGVAGRGPLRTRTPR